MHFKFYFDLWMFFFLYTRLWEEYLIRWLKGCGIFSGDKLDCLYLLAFCHRNYALTFIMKKLRNENWKWFWCFWDLGTYVINCLKIKKKNNVRFFWNYILSIIGVFKLKYKINNNQTSFNKMLYKYYEHQIGPCVLQDSWRNNFVGFFSFLWV